MDTNSLGDLLNGLELGENIETLVPWQGHNIFPSALLQVGSAVGGVCQTVLVGSIRASVPGMASLIDVKVCKISRSLWWDT